MLGHTLEYSKSSKARCHGPDPCNGTLIDKGLLRYGETKMGPYGESVEWRHWGCVTKNILRSLAATGLDDVSGFASLTTADQAKIKKAVARGSIDPADVPASAKGMDMIAQSNSQGVKRKLSTGTLPPSSSQPGPSSSQPLRDPVSYSQDLIDVDDEGEDNEHGLDSRGSRDELYCVLETKVVGIQYYNGLVGAGEMVNVLREPTNPYDRNAIQIVNIAGEKVGHLSRDVASRLSPLIDTKRVTVEGLMKDSTLTRRNVYSLKICLKIYGAVDARDTLEPQLIWATPSNRGFPPQRADGSREIPGLSSIPRTQRYASGGSDFDDEFPSLRGKKKTTPAQLDALEKADELRSILNNLEKVDDGSRRESLMDKLCPTADVLNLPDHPHPPGIESGDLIVDLLKHQRQALQWCIDHEYPKLPTADFDKPVQFWQLKENGNEKFYYNCEYLTQQSMARVKYPKVATKTPQRAIPELGRGGLCADSMGLGKTLTMLALILATKSDRSPKFCRATLIVVPLSVISNWEKQIKEHCSPGALKSHVYYGSSGRAVSAERLRKYDVVVTTYQVVTSEHVASVGSSANGKSKKRKTENNGLFDVPWKRIILDEGHTIRNARTKTAQAVCDLDAERRWVVTGTPIINTPRDLGSILSFLRVCKPLDSDDYFNRLILRPLRDGSPEGGVLLRAIMTQICIRRTKEMKDSEGKALVPLPGVEMITIPVALDEKTRELYDRVEQLSKQRVESFMNEHGGVGIPTSVLSMLTRLRQIVLHPKLIPSNYIKELENAVQEDKQNKPGQLIRVSPELKVKLQLKLAQLTEDCQECPICFMEPAEPRITGCAHLFCRPCITEVISRDPKCPMDRRQITVMDLVEPAPPDELAKLRARIDDDEKDAQESKTIDIDSSAKIKQLVKLLDLTPGNEKSLVFSQFTSFLDKIGEAFDEAGIAYVRFDGKMSAKARKEVIEKFTVPIDEECEDSGAESSPVISPVAKRNKRNKRKDSVIVIDSDEGESSATEEDTDDEFLDGADLIALTKASKGKSKGSAKKLFDGAWGNKSNPKVMLISLKAGALGLNLTVANNVFLMDPWWQEGIESQAIDRCNRIGQKKKVHVYQLIAENTVESKVIDIQDKKKKLVSQAFSGIKGADDPRQKREARMQDIIQLFGMRREEERTAASQSTSRDRSNRRTR